MKTKLLLIFCFLLFVCGQASFAQITTSWKGTTSTAWATASNWTNGVPTAAVSAIIGDANFTGANQPTISATSSCLSLTIGGTKASTLTVSGALTVNGTLTLNTNGTFSHTSRTTTLKGDVVINGTYTPSGVKTVTFGGTTQSISGTGTASFSKVTINTGSTVTLQRNITLTSTLTLRGTLNPNEPTNYKLTATGITVNNGGVLKVTAALYTTNYSATPTIAAGGVVDYCSALVNQTVSNAPTYSTLRINGTTTKTLAGNLPALVSSATTAGRIEVNAGTLDLSTFTANRGTTTVGGAITLASGATLKTAAASFPANYSSVSLNAASTVQYYGGAQTVSAQTYGNLILSSNSGAAVKTMPGTAMTINGSLSTSLVGGTSVSFTAGNNITVLGSVNLAASTTFNASSFSHTVTGSWVNSGTLTGSTSTFTLNGPGSSISGTGTYNFNNLTITASGYTAANNTNISVAGNLSTTGSGAFTHTSGSTGTVTMTGASKTLSGAGFIFNNFTSTGTLTAANSITVAGSLSVTGGTFTGTNGTITMTGASKSIVGGGTANYGTLIVASGASVTTTANFNIGTQLDVQGSLTASSASTVTINGTASISGSPNLYNLAINSGNSLTLSANVQLGIANSFTNAGTFSATTNIPTTVNYNGTGVQTILSATYYHLNLSNGNTKTAGGALTINRNFNIGASTTFAASTYTHTIQGNYDNYGTYTPSTSTLQFTGASDVTFYESGTPTSFPTLTLNKTASTNKITLSSNLNVATLNMTSGEIFTGSKILTITTTRTENGIIWGNIWRTHSFTTGTSYAFEGPNNTINFSSVSGLSTVKVVVTPTIASNFPDAGSINRLYNITMTGATPTYNATLRLHYDDIELNGNNESNMTLWSDESGSWANKSKSANDATNNYVENSGFTNLNGNWSISDMSNVVSWNGSVSSDWATPANWTTVIGTPSTPPSASDVVQIGVSTFTNQPTISTVATAKSILFGSAKAATLTLAGGGSLTSGTISGQWSGNATHTIDVGAQNLTINGNFIQSDGTSNHVINLTSSTGTATVSGNVNELGGANITFTGAGTLKIGGDFNYTSGTFTRGTGTVEYNGSIPQLVSTGVIYNNLKINKSASIASASANLDVRGNLDITAGEFDITNTANVDGDLTIASGAIFFNNGAYNRTFGGSWTNSGTYIAGSGTVTFDGTGAQSVSASTFNNLIVDKASGTLTLTAQVNTTGDATIQNGTVDLSTFTVQRTTLGGTMSLNNNSTLRIGGLNNVNPQFNTYTFSPTSTVEYYDSGTSQYVGFTGATLGNVILDNGGSANPKIQVSNFGVSGDITITNDAKLNAQSYTTTIAGNFTNNGAFDGGTGLLILNGASKTISGSSSFNKVTVYGSYTISGTPNTFNGLVTIDPAATLNLGSGVTNISGDVINYGRLQGPGTTNFTCAVAQTWRWLNAVETNFSGIANFLGTVAPTFNSTSSPTFNEVHIYNTAGINPVVNWYVNGNFRVHPGGVYNGSIYTQEFRSGFLNEGTYTSTSGNVFYNPSAPVTLANTGTFTSAGVITIGGSGLLTFSPGGSMTFTNFTVNNTNAAGVSAVSNMQFGGDLTIGSNATFNPGTYTMTVGGNLISNGTITPGSSTFIMTSPTAEITTSVTSTFKNFTINTGASLIANSDFNVSGDFMNNGAFDAANSNGGLTMVGSGASTIGGTTTPSTLGILNVNKSVGAVATLASNISLMTLVNVSSGTLNLSSYTVAEDATNTGILIIGAVGTLQIGGTNTLPAFTSYNLDVASTVEYNGTTQSVSKSASYGNLLISSAGNKTAVGAINVLGNFTLSDGTFIGGTYTHNIAGNWLMSGGTFNNSGTIINLNGTGAQTISSTGSFSALTVNKTAGTATLLTDITATGVLTLTNGTITTGAYKVILPSSGSVTRTGGWVNGNFQKYCATGATSKTFEIGDATSYSPITVAFASVTTAGDLIASTTKYDHPQMPVSLMNVNKSVNRYWTLTNSGIVFTTATVTPTWVAGDVDAGSTTSNFRIKSYDGYVWSLLTYTNALATSIQATNCTELGDFSVGEPASETQWTGNVSSRWDVSGNWSSGVPDASTNVLIPSGRPNNPVVNSTSGDGAVQHITVASGATLTVTGAKLTVTGNISTNGTFTASAGTIEMGSTAAQVIPSGTFASNTVNDLIVNNELTVTMVGDLTVSNSLTLTKGQLVLGAYTLTVNGSIDKTSGELTGSSSSNMVVGGSSTQLNLPSIELNNLTLNRANGLTNTGNVTIDNVLTLTNGVFTLGADTLRLSKSPSCTSGSINASATNATLEFDNSSAVTLPSNLFSSALYNLYLKGSGGVTAGSDITINGVLNLEATNPLSTKGLLDMPVTAYLSASNKILYMGANSSTIGLGDVTGEVRRTSVVANTPYTFGNQYTTVTFTDGDMPSYIAVVIGIGSHDNYGAHWPTTAYITANSNLYDGTLMQSDWVASNGTNPVKRTYGINMGIPSVVTNSSYNGTRVTLNMHYLDSELNGLSETNLVTGDYDIDVNPTNDGQIDGVDGTPYADEHGRSAYDFTNKFIGNANVPLAYFIQKAGIHDWYTVFSIHEHISQAYLTWDGSYSSDWNTSLNWTPVAIPDQQTRVVIPNSNLTNNNPVLPSNISVASMTFNNGSNVNLGSSVITINNGSGAWNNEGGNVNPGTSTVKFAGIGYDMTGKLATISGNTDFYNIEIADTATIVNQAGNVMRIFGNIIRTGAGTGKWIPDDYDAIIEYAGGNQTILAPDVTAYHTLMLSGSGTKTLPATAMTFHGDFIMSDTITATAGGDFTVGGNMVIGDAASFNTSAYTHDVTDNLRVLGNMNVNNGGVVQLSGTASDLRVGYAGRLYNQGTISVPSGGFITLVGNDSLVGQLFNKGTLTNAGKVRFEKDFLASTGWYFMSFPFDVSEANITDWTTGNVLTWGDLTSSTADYYVGRYDGVARDAGGNPNVTGAGNYWANATSHKFNKNQGYIVAAETNRRIRFTADNANETALFGATNVSPTLTKAVTNTDSKHWSWNLMGNPFSAGFDLQGASQDDAPFYYYNGVNYSTVMKGDSYKTYPFTSFFLQAFGSGSTLICNKDNIIFKAATETDYDEVDISIKESKHGSYDRASDRFRLRVRDDATTGFDKTLDGLKFVSMNTTVPQLYSKYDGSSYSVNSMPKDTLSNTMTIPLTLYSGIKNASYTIRLADKTKIKRFSKVYLTDAITGAKIDLLTTPAYTFTTTSTGTVSTRLALVLESTDVSTGVVQPQEENENSIVVKTISGKLLLDGLQGKATVAIYDMTGRIVAKYTDIQNKEILPLILTGVYLVTVQTETQDYKAKVMMNAR